MAEMETVEEEGMLQEMELDALKEAGNIGASHASTAMSCLVHATVMINVPDCIVCRTEDLPHRMGHEDERYVATFFQTYGKGTGNLLMVMSYDTAVKLSDLMMNREYHPGKELDDEGMEAISEMGNICTSAYLNAMAAFLGTTILPSPPSIAVDLLGAIMQFPASLVAEVSDYVVILKTSFVIDNETYQGSFVFLPDPESQRMLLAKFLG